jgi:hypothetical protein
MSQRLRFHRGTTNIEVIAAAASWSTCWPMPNNWPLTQKNGSQDFGDELQRGDVQDPCRWRSSHIDFSSPLIVATQHRGGSSDFIAQEVQEEDDSNMPEQEPTNTILPQPHHLSSPLLLSR